MVYKACRGNTMAEYGLLLALLAVACMGGLSLLGNAMSNLHNNISARLDNVTSEQQATAKQADKDSAFARAMAALGISDANQAEWKESADMLEMESGVDGTQMPHFRIPKTSSSDANSTGASGDMMLAYAQSIKVANQLLEAAAKTQDASLKQWYLDTALQTVKLAKNQAAFEYNRDTDNT
jgi:Flp pilus assembly pilin Flp